MCRRGAASGVVVHDLSRLSREDLLGTAEVWAALEEAGADLIDATSGGKVRRLEYVVRAELNRQQWEAARDRGNDARRRAIARGAYVSARIPFGYTKVGGQRLVPDAEVVPIVVELFERRARGESWSALARWMDLVGYPMSRSGLKGLVGNEAYLGVARSGGYRTTVAVSPSFRSAGVLAIIVVIRTFLSMALQLELEGRWPWQQAPAGAR